MRQNNPIDTGEQRRLAWKNYAERQFDKWVKWSFEIRGEVRYKDILKMQEKYKVYGEKRKWIE